MGGHNRIDVENIVYSSMNDDDIDGGGVGVGGGAGMGTGGGMAGGGGSPHRRSGMHSMLSFEGTLSTSSLSTANSSHRLMSSGLQQGGPPDNDGTGEASPPPMVPGRLPISRHGSSLSSMGCLIPTLSLSTSLNRTSRSSLTGGDRRCRFGNGIGNNVSVDPFTHNQLHVLHHAALHSGSNNNANGITQFDSLLQAENRLRNATKSIGRRIPKTPSRILAAPELVDDYYLNLVSWSESNTLAVALGQCMYLWEANTGNIRHLLTLREESDFVTSVSWVRDKKGNSHFVAVGTNHNVVQLWDAEAERRLRTLDRHSARVGALSWNQHWLSSGGRDLLIVQHDVRSRNHVVSTYVEHTQEVCGLLLERRKMGGVRTWRR
jgi:hypothetical protein